MSELARQADVLGVIVFIVLSAYFISREDKTPVEWLLLVVVIIAAITDIVFSVQYYSAK